MEVLDSETKRKPKSIDPTEDEEVVPAKKRGLENHILHAFDGQWKNLDGETITIDGTLMNNKPIFSVLSENRVQLQFGEDVFQGKVEAGGQFIAWDDDDEWTKIDITGKAIASPGGILPSEPSPIPEPRSIDWGGFSDADASQPLLRTGKYLRTKKQSDKKPTDRPALAQFIGSEMFISTEECPQHIAQCKKSQYYEMIQKDQSDRFYIVINNRATAKLTSCCTWWYLDAHIFEENPNFAKLWWKFCEGTDEFRNQRFKCYPRIIDGSWSLKMMVPNVPTLLGQKVPVAYFKGRNYIELGIECDNNYLAKSILRIAFPISKSLVIDQCYILQTDTEEELPELVFAGVRYTKIDLSKAISVDEEPVRE